MSAALSPRVRTFRSWLSEQLESLPDGTRLMPARELASTFAISQSSVTRILRDFAKRNRIHRVRGSGTFSGPAPAAPPVAGAGETDSPRALVDKIESLIFNGTLRRGSALPSLTYMKQRFRVGGDTVTRAYRMLAQRRRVHKVGRRYWVGSLDTLLKETQGKAVYLVRIGTHAAETSGLIWAYEKLEKELLANGYCLRVISERQFRDRLSSSGRQFPMAYGFVLHCFTTESAFRETIGLLQKNRLRWRQSRAPALAVVVNFKPDRSPIVILNCGHVDTVVARTCAGFLDSRGADKVVLAIPRYEKPLVFERLIKLYPELRYLNEHAVCTVAVDGPPPGGPDDLLTAARASKPWGWFDSIITKYRPISQADVQAMFSFHDSLEELFAAHTDGHTWVFNSARAAHDAWNWCTAHGIDIPGRVSIVSLENSPQLLENGITACVPDWDVIGYMMAHRIIGDFPVALSHSGSLEMKATVLERESTP